MDTDYFLETMRLYRHQLMNELQVIHGFQTMGMKDESLKKMNRFIDQLSSERTLQSIDANQYVSWLLAWKIRHPEVLFSYQTKGEHRSLKKFDDALLNDVKSVIDQFNRLDGNLYLSVELSYGSAIELKYSLVNFGKNETLNASDMRESEMENKDERLVFQFRYE